MRNLRTLSFKTSILSLSLSLFLLASCSKKTAYVSQYDKLAYEQITTPVEQEHQHVAAIETITPEVSQSENNVTTVAPKLTETLKHKKNRKNTIARLNQIKNNAPVAVKEIASDKIASVKVLKSAAQSENKTMLDGNLKLAIVFLLLAVIVGLIPLPFFGLIGLILAIIGLVFLVLWVLSL